jgi:phosphoenolpyruvate synthase/pyruvate phosphate dikinase
VESAGLVPLLSRLAPGVEPVRPLDVAEEVSEAFLGAPLPAPVADAIAEAYRHASAGGPVAVRSSAVAEDLVSASFAGQYQSFLDVGPDGLEQAVRLCWASLWAPGARAYRHAQGSKWPDLAMGVVIQAMVPAERSGRLHTRSHRLPPRPPPRRDGGRTG